MRRRKSTQGRKTLVLPDVDHMKNDMSREKSVFVVQKTVVYIA